MLIREIAISMSGEELAEHLSGERGVVLLQSARCDGVSGRFSFVTANPFLVFRSYGPRCELEFECGRSEVLYGNPWRILDELISRYELLDEVDLPFPLGGCFGYWGYDLRRFVEPHLGARAFNDLELPECHLGFYDSLIAFDHTLDKAWLISTGLRSDGSRDDDHAEQQTRRWLNRLQSAANANPTSFGTSDRNSIRGVECQAHVESTFTRGEFIESVEEAQRLIWRGDIYQVNLSQRLSAPWTGSPWTFYRMLVEESPAPFAAFLDCGEFQIASSSPELFLRMSGSHVRTRPIKGTRPRSADALRDAQLSYELQTSSKEMAELVMITDLLRNDIGRISEFGSVHVPELVRLERFAQVQHLVSTVEGHLRSDMTHANALASCFPGGSITGAPKIRAMEIIDELEPVTRGPYTGALGYIGFNRESQLSIVIRAAICRRPLVHFQVGAGIVADSNPAAEFDETLAKAKGFLDVLERAGTMVRSNSEATRRPR